MAMLAAFEATQSTVLLSVPEYSMNMKEVPRTGPNITNAWLFSSAWLNVASILRLSWLLNRLLTIWI